jgi:hypothetical protein
MMAKNDKAKPLTMHDGGYPIGSQSDADSAWKLRRHSKNHSEEDVKAHISRAVTKLGLKHPAGREKSNLGFVLPSETLARLREQYSVTEDAVVKPKPRPAADAEREIIRGNKLKPQASKPHQFAKSTAPIDGAHRCLMCGQTEPDNTNGMCNTTELNGGGLSLNPQRLGQIPIAAGDVSGTWAPGSYTINTTQPFNGAQPTVLHTEQSYGVTSLTERTPPPALSKPNWAPDHPAFVTEMNGKTLVTAQATVDPALFERGVHAQRALPLDPGAARRCGAGQPQRCVLDLR